jgi:Ca2+-dependent lipid-binding protein
MPALPPIGDMILRVDVKHASNVKGKDVNGFSDPFCVVELVCDP